MLRSSRGLQRAPTAATKLAVTWKVDQRTGEPVIGQKALTRSIIRYLKGHGTHYNFNEGTWRYYRRQGLSAVELFQVLKPFSGDVMAPLV